MNAVTNFKWFFSHASVGQNMMDGLDDLHATNSTFYQIHRNNQYPGDYPPSPTYPGNVYEVQRGNPGWQQKITAFSVYVTNGWRSTSVDIVMDKMCYVDQDANVTIYLSMMTNLEALFPETRFVFLTMPITTHDAQDGFKRYTYNQAVRSFCSTNSKTLYDIADIESYDTNGTQYSTSWSGTNVPNLYSGFTTDNCHPNQPDGRQQIARGFYALADAILNSTNASPATANHASELRVRRINVP
jgi:hypothetical protein